MSLYNKLIVIVLLTIPFSSQALLIQGPSLITPTTSIASCGNICGGKIWDINEIADGDTSNLNGFAGLDGFVGIITLDLVGNFDLESFSLWNDINVAREGVETFKLNFFDELDNLIESSSTLIAPIGSAPPGTYIFDTVVKNVSKVELETLTLLSGGACCRIEIREVAFNGEYSVTRDVKQVSEPATFALLAGGFAGIGLFRRRRNIISNK
jgi:hypothetical protein